MSAERTMEEWKETITRWLKEEKMFRREAEDDTATFHLTANYPPGSPRLVSIAQPVDYNDRIVIASGTPISPEYQKALSKLSAEERNEIFYNLRMLLMQRQSHFEVTKNAKTGIWSHVLLTNAVFLSELTKPALLRSIEDTFRGFLIIVWSLDHHLEGHMDEPLHYFK
jgi:hypothetical protein